MAGWGNASDIEFVYKNDWILTRCGVQSINGATITMKQPAWQRLITRSPYPGTTPIFIENAYELLDAEGEWYLDRAAKILYCKPLPGEDMAAAEVIAPNLEKLVSINGTLDTPVHDLKFAGLTFSHATWLRPNTGEGFIEIQAGMCLNPDLSKSSIDDWVKTPGQIVIHAGKNIAFERNTFSHLGSGGIDIEYGSQDNLINGNEFFDLSAQAVQLGDTFNHHPTDPRDIVKDNTVSNNYIHNVAAEYWGTCGITSLLTEHTRIDHNEIAWLPYTGISLGWGWGGLDASTPTICKNNEVTNNHIHHIMQVMYDGGALYTLGAQPGTLIEGNYFHDQGAAFGLLYFDAGSKHYIARHNVIHTGPYSMLLKMDSHRVEYNFWDTENQADNVSVIYVEKKVIGEGNWVMAHNQVVPDLNVMPASIIRNAGVEPAYRDLVPSTPASDTTPPSAPAGLQVTSVTDGGVHLTWQPNPTIDGVTGYEIYMDGQLIGVSAQTSFWAGGLAQRAAYSFSLKARDQAANLSPMSASVEATTQSSHGNIALGKPLYCWSNNGWQANPYNGHSYDKAVDGIAETYARAKGAFEIDYQQTLVLDLLAPYKVHSAVINFPTAPLNDATLYATDFNISVSDNGTTYTVVKKITNCPGGRFPIVLDGFQARYLAINVIAPWMANQSGEQMAIAELEVYGRPIPRPIGYKSTVLFSDSFSSGTLRSSLNGHHLDNALGGTEKVTWKAPAGAIYDVHTTGSQRAAALANSYALADRPLLDGNTYRVEALIDPTSGVEPNPGIDVGRYDTIGIHIDPLHPYYGEAYGMHFRFFNDTARNSMSPYFDFFYGNIEGKSLGWRGGAIALSEIDANGFFHAAVEFTGSGTAASPLLFKVFIANQQKLSYQVTDLRGGQYAGCCGPYPGFMDDFKISQIDPIMPRTDSEQVLFSDDFSSGSSGSSLYGNYLNNKLGGVLAAAWLAPPDATYATHTTSTQMAAYGAYSFSLVNYQLEPNTEYHMQVKLDPMDGIEGNPPYGLFACAGIHIDRAAWGFWDKNGVKFRFFNHSARNAMSPYLDMFYCNTSDQSTFMGGASLTLSDIDANGFFPVRVDFSGKGTSASPLWAKVYIKGALKYQYQNITDLKGGNRAGISMPYGGYFDDFIISEMTTGDANANPDWVRY